VDETAAGWATLLDRGLRAPVLFLRPLRALGTRAIFVMQIAGFSHAPHLARLPVTT